MIRCVTAPHRGDVYSEISRRLSFASQEREEDGRAVYRKSLKTSAFRSRLLAFRANELRNGDDSSPLRGDAQVMKELRDRPSTTGDREEEREKEREIICICTYIYRTSNLDL